MGRVATAGWRVRLWSVQAAAALCHPVAMCAHFLHRTAAAECSPPTALALLAVHNLITVLSAACMQMNAQRIHWPLACPRHQRLRIVGFTRHTHCMHLNNTSTVTAPLLLLCSADPERRALHVSPWLFASSICVLASLILLKAPLTQDLAWYWVLLAAVVSFLVAMGVAYYFFVPALWHRMLSSSIDQRCAPPAEL